MAYKCPIFKEGKNPMHIMSGNIEELKRRIGVIREFSELLVELGCKRIEVEAYDMGVDEGGPEREKYGIRCKTYDVGKGCETCILNGLDKRAKKLSDLYDSSTSIKKELIEDWLQLP